MGSTRFVCRKIEHKIMICYQPGKCERKSQKLGASLKKAGLAGRKSGSPVRQPCSAAMPAGASKTSSTLERSKRAQSEIRLPTPSLAAAAGWECHSSKAAFSPLQLSVFERYRCARKAYDANCASFSQQQHQCDCAHLRQARANCAKPLSWCCCLCSSLPPLHSLPIQTNG